MGFVVARKHARELRAHRAGCCSRCRSLLAAARADRCRAVVAGRALTLAALSRAGRTFVERWLFFAEAKHTVTLYYGAISGLEPALGLVALGRPPVSFSRASYGAAVAQW